MRVAFLSSLAIVGILAWGPPPTPFIPTSLTDAQGYVISIDSDTDAWQYEGFIELTFNASANSLRSAWQRYGDSFFGEASYRNGLYKEFDSRASECRVQEAPGLSLSSQLAEWAAGYSVELTDQARDPVWRLTSDYTILRDPRTQGLVYIRNRDHVVEYIVDRSTSNRFDIVIYFPEGFAQGETSEA